MVQTTTNKDVIVYTELSEGRFQDMLHIDEDGAIVCDIPFPPEYKKQLIHMAKLMMQIIEIKSPGKTRDDYLLLAFDNAIYNLFKE